MHLYLSLLHVPIIQYNHEFIYKIINLVAFFLLKWAFKCEKRRPYPSIWWFWISLQQQTCETPLNWSQNNSQTWVTNLPALKWLTISSHGTIQSEWKKWLQGSCLTGSPTEKSSLHTGHSIQQSGRKMRKKCGFHRSVTSGMLNVWHCCVGKEDMLCICC